MIYEFYWWSGSERDSFFLDIDATLPTVKKIIRIVKHNENYCKMDLENELRYNRITFRNANIRSVEF
jgi:hypothetical protein